MKKLFALQGIIFQQGFVHGLAHKPDVEIAVTIQKAMNFSMLHGIVGPDESGNDKLIGHMSDRWGDSEITNFEVTANEVKFTKKYQNRPEIFYKFSKKEGEVWLGKYIGDDCGSGETKLIITPINETFFNCPEL